MPSRRHSRTGAVLLQDAGAAAASVVAARAQAFSTFAGPWSAWHRSELLRMGAEKVDAAGSGLQAAGMELAMLPWRLMQLAIRPGPWTPAGSLRAWTAIAELWFGVGNAALRPARNAAVRNRARLAWRASRSAGKRT
jgi:hypothetical protein